MNRVVYLRRGGRACGPLMRFAQGGAVPTQSEVAAWHAGPNLSGEMNAANMGAVYQNVFGRAMPESDVAAWQATGGNLKNYFDALTSTPEFADRYHQVRRSMSEDDPRLNPIGFDPAATRASRPDIFGPQNAAPAPTQPQPIPNTPAPPSGAPGNTFMDRMQNASMGGTGGGALQQMGGGSMPGLSPLQQVAQSTQADLMAPSAAPGVRALKQFNLEQLMSPSSYLQDQGQPIFTPYINADLLSSIRGNRAYRAA